MEQNKELIQRMRAIARASMGADAVRVPPGIQALLDSADALERAAAEMVASQSAEPVAPIYLAQLRNGSATWLQFAKSAWEGLDESWDKCVANAATGAQGLTSQRVEEIANAYFHQDGTELGDMKTAIRVAVREALAQSAPAATAPNDGARQAGPFHTGWCRVCKGSCLPGMHGRSEDQVISDFLDRTGQYVTNDASRQDAIAEALAAAQPPAAAEADKQALRWATQLAISLHRKHYAAEAPNWEPLPDLVGVISQIDNMTAGLTRAAPQSAAQDARDGGAA